MKRLGLAALALAFVGLVSPVARAEDPTGTWKWTVTFNNNTREQTLKLKLDGDKLTGAVIGRNNQETAIEDGSYKAGELSFKVTRERNGQKFTSKFEGKVSGDTIKGKMMVNFGGDEQTRDWEAKRVKD